MPGIFFFLNLILRKKDARHEWHLLFDPQIPELELRDFKRGDHSAARESPKKTTMGSSPRGTVTE
jgi:hypothetical protein